ncbi:hypothetical protein BIY22_19225 [Vibrio panuliri]|uniref:Uncharacterized protein n=1 Tax=Vibrio panuliri TaxID=1381081 RepID=A0A1Q9HHM3_9VIBR|nr:hypothetical protein [Vibrio panuliri]OLQ89651.1 hypothetical protein BIY22_19225 [Vibrio panuliri]
MLEKEIITLVLGVGLVSAFVTALFSKLVADKNHKIENITRERKEWRDRLRFLVVEITKAQQNKDLNSLKQLEAELIVRLNPQDTEDLAILNAIEEVGKSWSDDSVRVLCDRISYLLKHDWERVKQETTSKVSSQSLTTASIVATLLMSAFFGFTFGYWLPIVLSGLFLTSIFALPTLIHWFVIKRYLAGKTEKASLKAVVAYLCNDIQRDKYEKRSKR